ncbi:hypothetical protein HgNV_075 [Homarus gammarus nudivirus]|uniref:Uncharacterized protein n=1 Tax=Homarus gammarus nudivirus TaxID=2509616 RepID=A0A411HB90_9VIRU|nr:hypothetical protein KM727_gp75 [Homarus gammarus nudivirus]QBB28680.1 hypothetical protein HgNV_075 [Homarus gammarus nudivirus]
MSVSIYFADLAGNMSKHNVNRMNIDKKYDFNTKQIDKFIISDNTYNIGDILIGLDFIVCISYENIDLLEANIDWGLYLSMICDLLAWPLDKNLKIYTNNINAILKHTSLETANNSLKPILESLSHRFNTIEIC